MRHRSPAWPLLLLTAVAVTARPSPSRADEAGTSKSFPEKNFSWSLPAGWTLEDADGDNKEAGYVCIARKEIDSNKGASAWALVVDAGGALLDSLVTKAVDNKKQKLADVDSLPAAKTDWAGVTDARYVQIGGKSKENGAAIAHRLYSAVVDGKLHQLDIKAWNGAEADLMSDLDAVAAGYKVLKGGTARTGSSGSSGGGDSGAVEGDPHKVRFDKLGLTWTLPVRPQIRNFTFTARGAADVVTQEKTSIHIAAAQLDGEGPSVDFDLAIEPVQPGGTTKGFINNDQNFEKLIHENFDGTPVPNLDEDVKLGNWHGAMKAYTGKDKAGRPLYIRTIFSVLRNVLYVIRITAHDKGETPGHLAIQDALGGLKWDNASEGVRGPAISEFPAVTEARPDTTQAGKEKVFKNPTKPAFSFKRPAALGFLKFDAMAMNTWMLAMEGRKPGAYMFVGVKRYTDAMLRGSKPPLTAEGLIDELEGLWKNGVEDPKTQFPTGGNKTPDTFAGIKGQRYEFSGTYEGHPFIEKGYLVMAGINVMFIRMQYGGKDAEAAFAAETKAILQSFKFD